MADQPQAMLPGQKAPIFKLQDADGQHHSLKELCGAGPLVLYFYPQDDTETCTKQACAFRDAHEELNALGLRVVGISPDSVESHSRFVQRYALPFLLLSDPGHVVCEKYHVWREKTLYGRTYMGVVRTTFIIDTSMTIRAVFDQVRLKGHVDAVVQAYAQL